MPSKPAPNPNVPQINQALANLQALAVSVNQVKQGVDSLGGNRGNPLDRAVTFNDLIAYGLLASDTLDNATNSGATGGVFSTAAGLTTTMTTYINASFMAPKAGIVAVSAFGTVNGNPPTVPSPWSMEVLINGKTNDVGDEPNTTPWYYFDVGPVAAGKVAIAVAAATQSTSFTIFLRGGWFYFPNPASAIA
jgi:hypothetical protein